MRTGDKVLKIEKLHEHGSTHSSLKGALVEYSLPKTHIYKEPTRNPALTGGSSSVGSWEADITSHQL